MAASRLRPWLTGRGPSDGDSGELVRKILEREVQFDLGAAKRPPLLAIVAHEPRSAFISAMAAFLAGHCCVVLSPTRTADMDAIAASTGLVVASEEQSHGLGTGNVRVYEGGESGAPPSIDARLCFLTSGTTGGAKVVPFSEEQILSIVGSLASVLQYRNTDTIVNAMPVTFDYGFYQYLLALNIGCTIRTVPRLAFLADSTSAIADDATILPITPAYGRRLATFANEQKFSSSSVRMITSTGARLAASTRDILNRVFPRADIVGMYGLTECKRICITPTEESNRHPESVGRVIPGVRLRIVDPDGTEVPPGTAGEGVVDGPHVAEGYWRHDPERNEHHRTLRRNTAGSWELWTGDRLIIRDDGYVHHLGRIERDFIKVLDEKTSLIEIEEACRKHPDVTECKVIHRMDRDGLVSRLELIVELAPGTTSTSKVAEHMREHVSRAVWTILDIVESGSVGFNDNGKV